MAIKSRGGGLEGGQGRVCGGCRGAGTVQVHLCHLAARMRPAVGLSPLEAPVGTKGAGTAACWKSQEGTPNSSHALGWAHSVHFSPFFEGFFFCPNTPPPAWEGAPNVVYFTPARGSLFLRMSAITPFPSRSLDVDGEERLQRAEGKGRRDKEREGDTA